MHITLYHRSYPVEGAPVAVSLIPFPTHQKHTFTAAGAVYPAEYKELCVVVPDGAVVGTIKGRLNGVSAFEPVLSWDGAKGAVVSTAKEVLELARARGSGFRMAK